MIHINEILKEVIKQINVANLLINEAPIIIERNNKKYIVFNRVNYGKVDTPMDEREYRLTNIKDSPVGTVKEIKNWIKDKGYDGFILNDEINKSIRIIEI